MESDFSTTSSHDYCKLKYNGLIDGRDSSLIVTYLLGALAYFI